MPFCKHCKREFDYVMGQKILPALDMKYCSDLCWKESKEFTRKIKNFRCLLKKIPWKQRLRLLKVLIDEHFDEYEIEYYKVVMEFCAKYRVKIFGELLDYQKLRQKAVKIEQPCGSA